MFFYACAALLLLHACEGFIDRKNGLHLFALPELRSPLQRHLSSASGGHAWRNLVEVNGAYPTVHDAHEFVGATRHGYIVLNTSSILKSTTVQSDDYSSLLSTAELTCLPRAVPAEHAGQGHVTLRIAFPAGVSSAEALEHLARRLALPEAVLVLGVDTLLHHPSLGDDSSCVALVPREPYFTVVALARAGADLVLDVSPASPPSAFHFLRFNLQHTPDTAAGVARRRAAGLFVGRELASTFSETKQWGANWNSKLGVEAKAAVAKLSLFPAPNENALYCENCFFYLSATLNVNVQVCAVVSVGAVGFGDTYHYDANLPSDLIATGFGYYWSNSGTGAGTKDKSGTKFTSHAQAAAATDCGEAGLKVPRPGTGLNLGLSVEVFFEGSAAFNFAIKSDGVDGTLAFPTACIGQSSSCVTAPLPGVQPITVPTITVPGIPLTIDAIVTLTAAGIANLKMPNFKLQLGAAASVDLKLGGGVSFSGLNLAYFPKNIVATAYSNFKASFQTLPFILSGFTSASGGIDVTVAPSIAVKLWKFIPVTVQPQQTFKHSLAVSASTSRALRGDEDPELSRGLQGTACAAGTLKSASTSAGALGVTLEPLKTFDTVKTLTGITLTVPSYFDVTVVPQTLLVNPAEASFSVDGAVDAGASGCVTVGTPVGTGGSVTPGGPGGGGSTSAGGSASPGSASLGAGAIAGIVIGSLVLVGLTAFAVWRLNPTLAAKFPAPVLVGHAASTSNPVPHAAPHSLTRRDSAALVPYSAPPAQAAQVYQHELQLQQLRDEAEERRVRLHFEQSQEEREQRQRHELQRLQHLTALLRAAQQGGGGNWRNSLRNGNPW